MSDTTKPTAQEQLDWLMEMVTAPMTLCIDNPGHWAVGYRHMASKHGWAGRVVASTREDPVPACFGGPRYCQRRANSDGTENRHRMVRLDLQPRNGL